MKKSFSFQNFMNEWNEKWKEIKKRLADTLSMQYRTSTSTNLGNNLYKRLRVFCFAHFLWIKYFDGPIRLSSSMTFTKSETSENRKSVVSYTLLTVQKKIDFVFRFSFKNLIQPVRIDGFIIIYLCHVYVQKWFKN